MEESSDSFAEAGGGVIGTIDDSCRLRILHPHVYDRSLDLVKASSSFRANISRFHEEIQIYWATMQMTKKALDHINEQAQKVENSKLRAMAMRNLVQAEIESRPKKLEEQGRLVADKQMELERLNVQYESLQVVKREQESMIAQLTRSTQLS